jgi:hypothetical protein
LRSSIDKGLADLKSEAERRPAADTSRSTVDTSSLAADQRQAPEQARRSS